MKNFHRELINFDREMKNFHRFPIIFRRESLTYHREAYFPEKASIDS